jgi:hypothetical protein
MARNRLIRLSFATACFLTLASRTLAAGSGPFEFPYGGRVTHADGQPLEGPVDLELAFFRTETGGNALSAPLAFPSTSLSAGIFQLDVTLDPTQALAIFPDAEQPVWIEVRDLTHGRTFARQRLLGAPYALRVPVDGVTLQFDAAGALKVVQAPAFSGALAGDVEGDQAGTVVTKIQGAPVASTPAASGQVLKWNGSAWAPANEAGGAAANTDASNLTSGTLDDARLSANVSLLGSTIEGNEIAADAIATAHIADGGISSAKLIDGAVSSAKLADGAVSSAKLVNGAVSSAKLADGAVTAVKLADAGCTSGQLLKWNGSAWTCASDVDTPTTNAASLTSGTLDDTRLSANVSKLGATIEGNEIAAGAVSTAQLADGAVTASKLASAGCTSGQMLKWNGSAWACASDVDSNTPTTSATDLTTGTLDDVRLSANVSKLGATIESSEITDGTIIGDDIASGAIGDAHVAAGIDALKIGGGGVSNTELGYLDGVTSPIQTQLTGRVAKTGDELSGSLSVNIAAGAGTQNAIVVKNSQRLRFENDQASPNSISLRAPTGVFTNQTYVLPAAPGTTGQVLQTDASGNLSWTTPGSSLSSLTQLTVSCTAGQVIKSDGGGSWSCQADADSAGAGGSTPADGSVSTAKLVDGAVTAAKLNSMGCLNGQVMKYNGAAWTCAADANDNVTSNAALLTSGTVAEARLPATVSLLGTMIDSSEITDGAVGAAKLAADAITSAKILDGTIANADISTSAAIATSKLAGAVTAISGNGLGALATLNTVGSSEISDGSIGNGDISGSAAIATSKLSGAVTAISGNGLGALATLSAVGASEITDGSIANADISGTAAISSTKISFVSDSISGNAVDGGTISNFASTGIDDNAAATAMTIDSSGSIGVGTTSPVASAAFEIASTTKGFVPPRMTTAQRDAIATPAAGTTVYNTDVGTLSVYSGSSWINLSTQSNDSSPDTFTFTDSTNAGASTVVTSDVIQLHGFDGGMFAVSGAASPEFRICADSTCSTVLSTWSNAARRVLPYHFVQLRATSSATTNDTVTTTASAGTTSDTWSVTTIACTAGSQTFNYTGSAQTFTVPANCTVNVKLWGGGGGGGSTNTGTASGSTGGATTFASLSAGGGGGGYNQGSRTGGAGGTASGGTINTNGAAGETCANSYSGKGGNAPGSGGTGGARITSGTAAGNNGNAPGGGGGGGFNSTSVYCGGGGGSGSYVEKTYAPGDLTANSSMTVTVGAGGAGYSSGTGPGGDGGAGRVVFTWY